MEPPVQESLDVPNLLCSHRDVSDWDGPAPDPPDPPADPPADPPGPPEDMTSVSSHFLARGSLSETFPSSSTERER